MEGFRTVWRADGKGSVGGWASVDVGLPLTCLLRKDSKETGMQLFPKGVLNWVKGLDATRVNTVVTIVSTLVGVAIFIWQLIAPACG